MRAAWTLARHDAIFPAEYQQSLPAPARVLGRFARLIAIRDRASNPGERLARALEELGPSYVKFGQVLATRADVIGVEFARGLSRLQDRMEPFGDARAREILQSELGAPVETLFAEFGPPVAAASIAQVHKAVTRDGDTVAVKILRPDVEARIYRDIAALQAMRTPIEGEAGIGYVMRRGYDLPPLNFDAEEIEALHVGLALLARTGDSALQAAASRICAKIDALHCAADWLQVAPWGAKKDDPLKGCVSIALMREAVRDERKLRITYRDADDRETERTVRPVGVVYHLDCAMLAGWCELRQSFRHFRVDRIWTCSALESYFTGEGNALRRLWLENNRYETPAAS